MADTQQARDDIRVALSDPRRLCELLGLTEGMQRQASGLIVRCPAHAEKRASCSVQERDGVVLANCHACGFGGDVFDLVAAVHRLDAKRDFPRVLELAADLAGVSLGRSSLPPRPVLRPVPAPEPSPEDRTAAWDALADIDEDCWEYLRSRGLADASDICRLSTVAGYPLTQALRDADGRVVAMQVRHLGGHEDAFRGVGPTGSGMFGDPAKAKHARLVVVCEGFADTLAATLAFRPVAHVAVVGVAGVKAASAVLALPWKGKRAAVAFDADEHGDRAAADLGAQLAKAGARVDRVRPEGGKDLADMHRAGVDLRSFFRRALTGFSSVAIEAREEREERRLWAGKHIAFGTRFLDEALGGIFLDDCVLIGGKSGKGKTQTALGIATHNAAAKRRVHYIALEAGNRELGRRIKYPLIAKAAWDDRIRNGDLSRRLNYLDWFKGSLDAELGRYEMLAEQAIAETLATLFVRYKAGASFDAATLDRTIRECGDDGTDLVILDHVHFVDIADSVNENRGLKQIMQCVRNAQDAIRKPVILVAHIRKADRKQKQLVPDLDDFHGSSDAVKIATKAVMLAPAFDQPQPVGIDGQQQRHLAPTYIDPGKCRADGSRTRFCALVDFNFRTGRYESDYTLGRLESGREKFIFCKDEEKPEWAKPESSSRVA
jgi:hypothetical protein